MTCEARQYSDQMQCGRCGLAWDVNDPEPPRCRTAADQRTEANKRHGHRVIQALIEKLR